MSVKEKKQKVSMKDLDDVIATCRGMLEDNLYKLERAKSPANKRNAKSNISFWGSAAYYLSLVEAMTDDEVLNLETRIKGEEGGEDAG